MNNGSSFENLSKERLIRDESFIVRGGGRGRGRSGNIRGGGAEIVLVMYWG